MIEPMVLPTTKTVAKTAKKLKALKKTKLSWEKILPLVSELI